ncbi:MAG TPA: 30S ribosomal protein S6 [Terriglobia bacterium]|nr:30S ribosomal protein S6 [Terriglobia bacterium]
MRSYELMFIVVPTVTDEEIDKLVAQMEGAVSSAGGEVLSADRLGKRKLAYRIARFEEGFYILLNIRGTGEMIKELERRLKVTDSVIRFVTVRVDEVLKRVEKAKAARLKKARKRSPGTQPEATAPAI